MCLSNIQIFAELFTNFCVEIQINRQPKSEEHLSRDCPVAFPYINTDLQW